MRDTEHARGKKGMVKNPGTQKHIKTEIALCGNNSG